MTLIELRDQIWKIRERKCAKWLRDIGSHSADSAYLDGYIDALDRVLGMIIFDIVRRNKEKGSDV